MDATRGEEPRVDAVRARLAFLAFTLAHAGCGDGPVELRVDEGCLLEWCPECFALGAFVSSARSPAGEDSGPGRG